MKNTLSVFTLLILVFSSTATSAPSPEQKALVENLPADQQAAALEKLMQADGIQTELEEIMQLSSN